MENISRPLLEEWHPIKNGVFKASLFSSGSGQVVWWLAKCGHEWEASIGNRSKDRGCPFCSNRKIIPGFNDIATINPILAFQWHPTKNGDLLATHFSVGSQKKVWWLGNCGHEWESTIVQRNKGAGCLYCTNQKVLKGFNDLETFFPHLALEWDYQQNYPLLPSEFTTTSGKKAWWKSSSCGHKWQSAISHRSKRGQGCGICSAKLIGRLNAIPKKGASVAEKYPELIEEWHPTKNSFTPENTSSGSNRLIHWTCYKKGHEWVAPVYNRTGKVINGCPTCAKNNFISKPEQEIADFFTLLGYETKQGENTVLGNRKHIDIFIPTQNFGVEFNGIYWHSEKMGKDEYYHYEKFSSAKKAGIELVQIWEDDWCKNKNLILKMLAYKIGSFHKLENTFPELYTKKIFARQTTIETISDNKAKEFLNTYHIEGFIIAKHHIALKNRSQEIIGVVSIDERGCNDFEILRYATSRPVVGGFSKLIKFLKSEYGILNVIAITDNCNSSGDLYKKNGFVLDKEIPPNFMYLSKKKRVYERPKNSIDEIRIWDAGKTQYRIDMKSNL